MDARIYLIGGAAGASIDYPFIINKLIPITVINFYEIFIAAPTKVKENNNYSS